MMSQLEIDRRVRTPQYVAAAEARRVRQSAEDALVVLQRNIDDLKGEIAAKVLRLEELRADRRALRKALAELDQDYRAKLRVYMDADVHILEVAHV